MDANLLHFGNGWPRKVTAIRQTWLPVKLDLRVIQHVQQFTITAFNRSQDRYDQFCVCLFLRCHFRTLEPSRQSSQMLIEDDL